MKKLAKYICIFIVLIILNGLFFINYKNDFNENDETFTTTRKIITTTLNTTTKETLKQEQKLIDSLKKEYNNDDIVLYLEIPNVLSIPILQTKDNKYYLKHDIKKKYKPEGWPFLDYRNQLSDRKLIIYGHNSRYSTLPFTNLTKYKDYSFYKNNPYIYLKTNSSIFKYKVFSSYIENNDFDYVNLNNFNGLSYYEHILKLKNKSFYETGVNLNSNSKILILQTCSYDKNYKGNRKYHLVLAVLEDK